MARGVDGRDVFVDDEDRRDFIETAGELKLEMPHSLLAYCLMGNHFHLAIKVESIPLSRIMQRLLTSYVLGFNLRHDREGHLFQARYKSLLCLDDAYLISLVRYIHANPVRAGLVKSPGDWPWSSHRQYTGRRPDGIADAGYFFDAADILDPGVRDYERWSVKQDASFQPWPKDGKPALLREELEMDADLDEIAQDLFPDDLIHLRSGSRTRTLSRKKSVVAEKALQNGHSLSSIAEWMGCTPSAICRLLRRNKSISQSLTPNA